MRREEVLQALRDLNGSVVGLHVLGRQLVSANEKGEAKPVRRIDRRVSDSDEVEQCGNLRGPSRHEPLS